MTVRGGSKPGPSGSITVVGGVGVGGVEVGGVEVGDVGLVVVVSVGLVVVGAVVVDVDVRGARHVVVAGASTWVRGTQV
ncbi:hypothetical protein MDOR_10880 [Mycolicibacterium doricum]|uniref:Uncharacterized protein n=1 Tax=Mycolicibacterium doricum TaxID=126673 RepID=A0A1X1T308_9MYCO|nr:hypothetical protein [Mycolicibacterium doricum]ORV38689.1 hypothetical protein AWC01_14160 [Mycolicibacterium doricum]BBZ06919.1 hypothetical protein MDOR_10880 [Mycolicibacterium doricum]